MTVNFSSNSFFDWGLSVGVNLGVSTVFDTPRDIADLKAIVTDSEVIFEFIEAYMPVFQEITIKSKFFINEISPIFGDVIINHSDKIIKSFVISTIRNFAFFSLPQDIQESLVKKKPIDPYFQLNAHELLANSLGKIFEVIGSEINNADALIAAGAPITEELFSPLASSLVSLFFPVENTLKSWVKDGFAKKIKEKSVEFYTPIADWFLGKKTVQKEKKARLPIYDELNQFCNLLAKFSIEQDKLYFTKMKWDINYICILEKILTPIIKEYLPNDFPEKGIKAIFFKALTYLSSDVFKIYSTGRVNVLSDLAFFETLKHFSKILTIGFSELHANQKQELTVDQFNPIAFSLVNGFCPKQSWVSSFLIRHQKVIFKDASFFLKAFFDASFDEKKEESYKGKLRNILWNQAAVAASGFFGDGFIPRDNPTKEDSIRAGLEPFIEQLQELSSHFVSSILEKSFLYLKNTHFAIKLIKFLNIGFSDQELNDIVSCLQKIIASKDEELLWVKQQLHHVISSFMMRGFILLAEKVPPDQRNPLDNLLFKMAMLFLEEALAKFPKIIEKIKNGTFSEEGSKEIIDSWINLLFQVKGQCEFHDHLPFPEGFKEKVGNLIKKNICLSFDKVLLSCFDWVMQKDQINLELNQVNKLKNLIKFSQIVPYLVMEGIPYYLRENKDIIVHKAMKSINPILSQERSDAIILKKMIEGLVNSIGESNSKDLKKTMEFIGSLAEVLTISIGSKFFSEMQNLNPGRVSVNCFVESLVIKILPLATAHFKGISQTKIKEKKTYPSRKDFIKNFDKQKILHPALKDEIPGIVRVYKDNILNNLPDNLKSDELKDLIKDVLNKSTPNKEDFLKKTTLNLYKILQINKYINQYVPDYLNHIVTDVFNDVVPGLLDKGIALLKNVGTINQILIYLLNKASKDEDDISIISKLFPDDINPSSIQNLEEKFNDQYQLDLQKEIGKAIEALVGLKPDRIPKYLVSTSLKDYASAAIGQSLRALLKDKFDKPDSILSLLDEGIGSLSDSFAPSKWDDRQERFIFFKTNLKGKLEFDPLTKEPIAIDKPNLKRFFPSTPQEKKEADDFTDRAKKQAEKNVPSFLRKLIDEQTDQIAIETFVLIWDRFEKNLAEWIIKTFGDKYGEKIFNAVLPVVKWIIKYPIAALVLIFNYTIWIIVSQVLKFIFNNQAKNRVQDVRADIHDNVILKSLELVMEKLSEFLDSVNANSAKCFS